MTENPVAGKHILLSWYGYGLHVEKRDEAPDRVGEAYEP